MRTRQATGLLNVLKPRARLEVRCNFFSVRVADQWNLVPDKVKMAKNPGHFKRMYKQHRSSRVRASRRHDRRASGGREPTVFAMGLDGLMKTSPLSKYPSKYLYATASQPISLTAVVIVIVHHQFKRNIYLSLLCDWIFLCLQNYFSFPFLLSMQLKHVI